MSEETMTDDSSHYEVSLTAGQAFTAFVLLLFSLAASFTFGLMVGKGQTDERLVVKHESPVITEGTDATAKPNEANLVELGTAKHAERAAAKAADAAEPKLIEEAAVPADATTTSDAEAPVPAAVAPAAADPTPNADAAATEPHAAASVSSTLSVATPKPAPVPEKKAVAAPMPEKKAVAAPAPEKKVAAPKVTTYAQLLSSTDAHSAETLAAKLIDGGFTSAYVERTPSATGMIYRVRVRFNSEDEAHASVARLRTIARSEPWITH